MNGPPQFQSFAHVSVPCRDLEEGKRFYVDVMGGKVRVEVHDFAAIVVAGTEIGIGTASCSFIRPGAEYPHMAFYAGPDEMLRMKEWLTECGVPSSNFWTRQGVEALFFFRDPSGNLIELFCRQGFKGADQLPRAGATGGGIAVDLEALRYTEWKPPARS
jgi:catechol 2,3-dioxygenase-like lactoylglutathione lyase family enzyme